MERCPEDEPLRRQWLLSAEEEAVREGGAELGAAALLCLVGKSEPWEGPVLFCPHPFGEWKLSLSPGDNRIVWRGLVKWLGRSSPKPNNLSFCPGFHM